MDTLPSEGLDQAPVEGSLHSPVGEVHWGTLVTNIWLRIQPGAGECQSLSGHHNSSLPALLADVLVLQIVSFVEHIFLEQR